VGECKVEIGQIWQSKKTDDSFDTLLTIKIKDIKGGHVQFSFLRDNGNFAEYTFSKPKESLCKNYELKEDSVFLIENISDPEISIGNTNVNVVTSDSNGFLNWTDASDTIITIDNFSTSFGGSLILGEYPTNKSTCSKGEIWHNNGKYYACVNNKGEELQIVSHSRKENNMFTFGNLAILIVLMFVVAKIAAKVNWHVFLYPIKKIFGFSKRTAKKVEEELKAAKSEWNKIDE